MNSAERKAARLARQKRRFRRGMVFMGILVALGVVIFIFSDQIEAFFASNRPPAQEQTPAQP